MNKIISYQCAVFCSVSCHVIELPIAPHFINRKMIIATFYLLLSALKVGFRWILGRFKVGYYRKRRSPLGRFFLNFLWTDPGLHTALPTVIRHRIPQFEKNEVTCTSGVYMYPCAWEMKHILVCLSVPCLYLLICHPHCVQWLVLWPHSEPCGVWAHKCYPPHLAYYP